MRKWRSFKRSGMRRLTRIVSACSIAWFTSCASAQLICPVEVVPDEICIIGTGGLICKKVLAKETVIKPYLDGVNWVCVAPRDFMP